jgi:hypothetical protein
MLNSKEKYKLEVVKSAICGNITNCEASKLLSVSERQIKRLKRDVRKLGAGGVIHKLKNRVSNNFSGTNFKTKVLSLIKTKYSDFKPSFASEKIDEIDGIKVNPETLRLWMVEAKLWKARKKGGHKYFSFRERKDYFGEMIQFDGSYHLWFEDRLLGSEGYPLEVCLLASIDDATSQIEAKFDMNESIFAVFSFWMEYIKNNGKPLCIYLDKFGTYKVNHKSAVDNFELTTQFQKALNILDIQMINANTPQAKGRVERLFGTLQDRLVKELRLNNINTIEDGNRYLKDIFIPRFNKKFAVIPKKFGNLHRKLQSEEVKNLGSIFSVKSARVVNNDYTIQFKNKFFQLKQIQPVTIMQRQVVQIEEWLNGDIKIKFKDKYLNYFKLPNKPEKIKSFPLILAAHKTNWKPPPNHPWKNFKI